MNVSEIRPRAGDFRSPDTLNVISIARAISCILIATFHVSQYLGAAGRDLHFTFNQTPGIHLFLVISGFVLVHGMRAQDRPLRFIARRLARVVPLYWILTAAAILLAAWRPWLLPAADLSPAGIASSFLFLPHADHLGRLHPILFVGWTLNYLVWFYVLVAATLLAPFRTRALLVTGAILAVIGLAHLLPPGPAHTFFSEPIQLEFAAGAVIGALARDPRIADWARTHSVWPILLASAAALLAGTLSNVAGAQRVLICGFPAAGVVFALACQDLYRKPFGAGVMAWIGRISYPVYLLHPLVIPVLGALILSRLGQGGFGAEAMLAATLIVTIAAAHLCNVHIERPLSDWLRRGRPWRRPVAGARTGGSDILAAKFSSDIQSALPLPSLAGGEAARGEGRRAFSDAPSEGRGPAVRTRRRRAPQAGEVRPYDRRRNPKSA